ncbi:hypothetical protein [Mesorhizobium sp. M0187]|uniref:hypothetical protein n=1 Tax=Mesorhizobium sp. M0187 TaxID=2956908 RepID=UPI00333DE345
MTHSITPALALAAKGCADLAEIEPDRLLAEGLRAVGAMLDHLGKGKSSALFEELSKRVVQTDKRELDDITGTLAVYLILCGRGQNAAAKLAALKCGHAAASTIKKMLLHGATNAEKVRSMKAWPEFEVRIKSAERRAYYLGLAGEQDTADDWESRVVDVMVRQAREVKARSAQISPERF